MEAINVLKERFGQTYKITDAYMQALLEISPPRYTLKSLRQFYDKCEAYVRGLQSLGQSDNSYGSLLVPIIMKKLPSEVRQHLAREHGPTNWDLKDLRKSILNEILIMEAGQVVDHTDGAFPTTSTFYAGAKSDRKSIVNVKKNISERPCVFCGDIHAPVNCHKVCEQKARISIVKRKNLCFNCLGNHHANECSSKSTCRHCHKRHHSSICGNQLTGNRSNQNHSENSSGNAQKNNTQPTSVNVVNDNEKEGDTKILHSSVKVRSNILLKTAVAPVWSGEFCTDSNILFDEGAQRSFVTEDVANKLNLKTESVENLQLSAFGKDSTSARQLPVPLQNHIRNVDRNSDYLRGLRLAHPITEEDIFEISILIGADYYWDFIEDRIIRGNGPTAVKSKLGYLLSGPCSGKNGSSTESSILNVLVGHKTEEFNLETFWKLESLGIDSSENNQKEIDNLSNYQDSSIEFRGDRYYAKLPWKQDFDELPSNYYVTKWRTENVIRRLEKEPDLLIKYGNILQEQERRGFIEKVDEKETTSNKIHYIPHHPVVKKDSSTTPIRIVYDCSCRISQEHSSLNDCLMSTPPILNDLSKILIRFRYNHFAITTDIEKAFLHVGLNEEDRNATRFLWLSDPTDVKSPLMTYRFKAVLFGATCSPFILNATILKHLQLTDSATAKMLERDLYVDNILSSVNDENEALTYFKEARQLMMKAGFNLRSWTSNSDKVRKLAIEENVFDTDEQTKVLGMRWNSERYELSYPKREIISHESQLVTKREILRQSSRIYDPLGLVSPITIRSKILMQELWKGGFDWDQPLEVDIMNKWRSLAIDIEIVMQTVFPRYYFRNVTSTENNLHVFVDASTKAYGAVASVSNGIETALVMAKTRVAPLKELTLPQLELMAAVVGARLAQHIQSTLDCSTVTLWSDSQIVLHWLKSTKTLKRFIANRVNEIHELTSAEWKFCPTNFNPADLLTRGITVDQFKESTLWMKGPHWLNDVSMYPNATQSIDTTLSLLSDNGNSCTDMDDSISKNGINQIMNIERYSSYRKLLRITAYVQRFIDNCVLEKTSRMIGHLKPSELQKAAETWIRNCQETIFSEEYDSLKSEAKTRNRLSRVRQLRLFLDDKKLMRTHGRIHNAPLPENTKFPFLLPNNHPLSRLIVLDTHERLLHSGVNETITQIRQNIWIPAVRQFVRKILKKCVICRRVIGKPFTAPDPPPLPKIRLQEAPPFTATGIDFTGALNIKSENNELTKAYICLFTCASTRAVHLEVVTNLSEETFLQAFRRFASRKSLPKVVLTDNASTFTSASEEMKKLCLSEKLHDEFAAKEIDWNFTPKRAPWFGGWWERLIGLTKTSLKKVLGRSLIYLETLQTIVTEIEAVLNDRPLTYISSDPEDQEPITPANLLYGRRINTVPYLQTSEIDVENVPNLDKQTVRKRSERQSLLLQQFWKRWRTEYLTSLRDFHKKTGDNSTTIKIGDIVQIHDEKRRILWKTGIVEDLITGKDELVRSAIVRTNTGTTSRPIVKLYPLEICDNLDSTEDEAHDGNTGTTTRRTLPNREAAQRAREKLRMR